MPNLRCLGLQGGLKWASPCTNKVSSHQPWWLHLVIHSGTSSHKKDRLRFTSPTPTPSQVSWGSEASVIWVTKTSLESKTPWTWSPSLARKLTTKQTTQTSSWCKTTLIKSERRLITNSSLRKTNWSKSFNSWTRFPKLTTWKVPRRNFHAFWSRITSSLATMNWSNSEESLQMPSSDKKKASSILTSPSPGQKPLKTSEEDLSRTCALTSRTTWSSKKKKTAESLTLHCPPRRLAHWNQSSISTTVSIKCQCSTRESSKTTIPRRQPSSKTLSWDSSNHSNRRPSWKRHTSTTTRRGSIKTSTTSKLREIRNGTSRTSLEKSWITKLKIE